MSMHFSKADQFDSSYQPTRLRNWQVPKWFPPSPLRRMGKTDFIANDKGHIIPGKIRMGHPFGSFKGTWDLPKKITHDVVQKLHAPDAIQVQKYIQRLELYSRQFGNVEKDDEIEYIINTETQLKKQLEQVSDPKAGGDAEGNKLKSPSCKPCKICSHPVRNELEDSLRKYQESSPFEIQMPTPKTSEKLIRIIDFENQKGLMYVPGELTNVNDRHETFKQLDDLHKSAEIKTSEHGFPQHKTYYQTSATNHNRAPIINDGVINIEKTDNFSTQLDKPALDAEKILHEKNALTNFCVEHLSKQQTNDFTIEQEPIMNCTCEYNLPGRRNDIEVKAYRDTVKNFRLAKELHKVNLEHNDLPDRIPENFYLEVHKPPQPGDNFASAVGWKGYKGFGANRCTKLKVFRPKTSPEAKQFHDDNNSITSFDRKWRFIKQNKVTPIEMAICWDLTPVNPRDEPRPPKHVDGSNGSVAPAVFTMVHPAKLQPDDDRNEPISGRNVPALFTKVSHFESVQKVGDFVDRPKTSHCRPLESRHEDLKRIKSAYNLHGNKQFCDAMKHYKSSPNLHKECNDYCCTRMFNNRLCVACELKNLPTKAKVKEEYKMAFKAGVPNSKTSTSSSSHITIKVPKPKLPYTKKNYSIDSLNAPFTLPKGKREDYPEHWRLASVYQHSYKPIHLRKKTFLQSVYQ